MTEALRSSITKPESLSVNAEDLKDCKQARIRQKKKAKEAATTRSERFKPSQKHIMTLFKLCSHVESPRFSAEDLKDSKQARKRQKKKTREEKEAAIARAEAARLQGDSAPETVEDFERLVLASPNSSFVWIKYMAFMLSLTEVDKARAVAER